MTIKKRGLGRGLEVLLGPVGTINTSAQDGTIQRLPVEWVTRSRYQPRAEIRAEGLQELADSIRAQGLIQPIVVRAMGGERYELIAGERRWRAAQIAGLAEVPALVREVSEQAAMAMALVENIQREDLNPLEEARALKRLHQEFGLTHQQVAEAVGRSRAAVTNLMRLLDLREEVQQLLLQGKLEMGHARALLGLPAQLQCEAGQQVLVRGLTVRETEQLVRDLQREPASGKAPAPLIDPNVRALQDQLAERLGAKVALYHSSSGKGRLVIQYHSLDELDGILARIK